MRSIAIFVLLTCLGCNQQSAPQVQQPTIEQPSSIGRVVRCSECGGKGEVVYDEDSPIVIHGFGEPGTYTCPMCNGFGELFEEDRIDEKTSTLHIPNRG